MLQVQNPGGLHGAEAGGLHGERRAHCSLGGEGQAVGARQPATSVQVTATSWLPLVTQGNQSCAQKPRGDGTQDAKRGLPSGASEQGQP